MVFHIKEYESFFLYFTQTALVFIFLPFILCVFTKKYLSGFSFEFLTLTIIYIRVLVSLSIIVGLIVAFGNV